MPDHPDPEQERLIRLRARQLADRDPRARQTQFNRMTAARERKVDRRITAGRMWKTIPHGTRGALVGFVLGTLVLIVLADLWTSAWVWPVALGIMLLLIVLGVVIGKLFDYRDNLRDLSK